MTFRCPAALQSVVEAVQYAYKSLREKYHVDTSEIAKLHTSRTASLCNVCSLSKTIIYTPKSHRLIELYQRSIPLYAHAIVIAKMFFEGNHQPLIEVLPRRTDTSTQNTVVHNLLLSDWEQHVSDTWKSQVSSNTKLSFCGKPSVRKLLLGKNNDGLLIGSLAEAKKLAFVLDDVI